MNCIVCGKEITQSYADSRFFGNYCRSCANNAGLTTEQINEFKDQQIAELKAENERLKEQLSTATMYHGCDILIAELQQQLKDNTKQVCEKIIDRMQNIEFNCDTDFQSMISILNQIENENV